MNTIKNNLLLHFLPIILGGLLFSQDDFDLKEDSSDQNAQKISLTGKVSDSKTGQGIAGANVVIDETDLGSATDENGEYSIDGVSVGSSVTVTVIGYDDLTLFADSEVLDFSINSSIIEMSGLDVVGSSIAKYRETPVAFSDIDSEALELRVGSRDLSMIMNEVPGAFATEGPGGSGDSRINIRGFDQRNISIMINGVPVNDMENGWVYWSNWDGIADVTSSIQVQRGLGATNLAVASVGGTVNVRTSAAGMDKGYSFKQELGSNNFLKSTLTASSGLMENGYSVSALLQRKTGKGWVDATWTDAYSYFFTVNKSIGDNQTLDFTLLGAPQQHGQRDGDNKHTAADWSAMSGYNSDYGDNDYRKINTGGSGSGWGYISEDNAKSIKMGTDESLDSFSDALFGGIQHTKQIGDKWIINNRTNYYHKPVYNLNHTWDINDQTKLSSVLYGSNGRGGGTGPLNSRGDFLGNGDFGEEGVTEYFKYINPPQDANGLYEWDKLINWNRSDWDADASNGVGDSDYISSEYRSKAIIRASVNHHDWYGLISNLKYDMSDVTINAGVDVRSYKGEHYREVVNLLGGDYYVDSSNDNWTTNAAKVRRVGDKVAYHNIGYNNWMGGYLQAEYSKDELSAFVSAAGSNTTYQREDFFNYMDDSGEQKSEKAKYPGSALKIGANYNFNENLNVFANAGALSVAPNFRSVYLNYNNTVNPEAKNEKVVSTELGLGYLNSGLVLFGQSLDIKTSVNLYHTNWQDKQLVITENDLIYNVQGVNAVHQGIELESRVGLLSGMIELYGALSLANWRWENDVIADVTSDYDRSGETYSVEIYAGGLPVGDAPQRQLVAGATYKAPFGLTVNPVFKFFDKHYASYSPEDLDFDWDAAGIDRDSYIPQQKHYSTIDLHVFYNVGDLLPVPVTVGFHLLNATDTEYFSDYTSSIEGFYGLGTRYNLSLGVSF